MLGHLAELATNELRADLLFMGIGAIIVLPLLYGALGFIVAVIAAWLYNLAAGMTWLKLDPTTSPWTLSPKTFTGTLPTTRDKPCRKIVWLPDLNAVAFCTHESAGFYIYRF